MPTKAAAASAEQQARLEAAPADAHSASTTITSTAALMPKSAPSTSRNALPERVEQAHAEHHQRAGKDEQDPRRESAARAVQQPADVGGELLRLGPRQQHAEIERVQEASLVDPPLLVDQHAVHQRDLARGSAEADAADLEPHPQRLPEPDSPFIAARAGRCGGRRRAASTFDRDAVEALRAYRGG